MKQYKESCEYLCDNTPNKQVPYNYQVCKNPSRTDLPVFDFKGDTVYYLIETCKDCKYYELDRRELDFIVQKNPFFQKDTRKRFIENEIKQLKGDYYGRDNSSNNRKTLRNNTRKYCKH